MHSSFVGRPGVAPGMKAGLPRPAAVACGLLAVV